MSGEFLESISMAITGPAGDFKRALTYVKAVHDNLSRHKHQEFRECTRQILAAGNKGGYEGMKAEIERQEQFGPLPSVKNHNDLLCSAHVVLTHIPGVAIRFFETVARHPQPTNDNAHTGQIFKIRVQAAAIRDAYKQRKPLNGQKTESASQQRALAQVRRLHVEEELAQRRQALQTLANRRNDAGRQTSEHA